MSQPRKRWEPPRIQRIELSEKDTKKRWILAGVFLAIGLICIAVGVHSCVSVESGWQEVQITADKTNCSGDFVLNYQYGYADTDPTMERRQVVACYSEAVVKGYELFNTDVEDSSLGNLTLLNANPNKPVTVDPALYRALTQIGESLSRHVYLAAVYEEYDRIFRADSEAQAADFDPAQNAELLPYMQEAAAYASDPDHIRLELKGNDQVCLQVSEEYLSFAEEYGIENFVDLGWLKNAFLADFLAQTLIDAGHTHGYLSSFDGYTRNLDGREESYSVNLFDRLGNNIYLPAVMHYTGPMSIVSLRNYPMSARDNGSYYLFANGTIVTALIDPVDGMSKSATDNLVGYSKTLGCAQIALELAPVFVADTLDTQTLNGLTETGIYSIWFDGGKLLHNEAQLQLTMQQVDGAAYAAKFAGNE